MFRFDFTSGASRAALLGVVCASFACSGTSHTIASFNSLSDWSDGLSEMAQAVGVIDTIDGAEWLVLIDDAGHEMPVLSLASLTFDCVAQLNTLGTWVTFGDTEPAALQLSDRAVIWRWQSGQNCLGKTVLGVPDAAGYTDYAALGFAEGRDADEFVETPRQLELELSSSHDGSERVLVLNHEFLIETVDQILITSHPFEWEQILTHADTLVGQSLPQNLHRWVTVDVLRDDDEIVFEVKQEAVTSAGDFRYRGERYSLLAFDPDGHSLRPYEEWRWQSTWYWRHGMDVDEGLRRTRTDITTDGGILRLSQVLRTLADDCWSFVGEEVTWRFFPSGPTPWLPISGYLVSGPTQTQSTRAQNECQIGNYTPPELLIGVNTEDLLDF